MLGLTPAERLTAIYDAARSATHQVTGAQAHASAGRGHNHCAMWVASPEPSGGHILGGWTVKAFLPPRRGSGVGLPI